MRELHINISSINKIDIIKIVKEKKLGKIKSIKSISKFKLIVEGVKKPRRIKEKCLELILESKHKYSMVFETLTSTKVERLKIKKKQQVYEAGGYRIRPATQIFLQWYISDSAEEDTVDFEKNPTVKVVYEKNDVKSLVLIKGQNGKDVIISQINHKDEKIMIGEPFDSVSQTIIFYVLAENKRQGNSRYFVTTSTLATPKDRVAILENKSLGKFYEVGIKDIETDDIDELAKKYNLHTKTINIKPNKHLIVEGSEDDVLKMIEDENVEYVSEKIGYDSDLPDHIKGDIIEYLEDYKNIQKDDALTEIDVMTYKELLEAYLAWNGIMGYDDYLITMNIEDVDDYLKNEGILGYTEDIKSILSLNESKKGDKN